MLTILEKISEGPTTAVYKAVQTALGRTVLLKVLHKHLLRDSELVERLRREAAACAALRSEHIVQVYTLEEIDGSPAIVMEFVEGESLKDYLSRTGERSERFARTVAAAVLRGLAAAHARGIIHRDIKPANLMVLLDGTVKITDFGLAAVGISSTLTAEGALIGTPAYMSPEQAKGEPVDHRTDLFSLGLTLLEIVSGKQIFQGASYSECITKILRFQVEDVDAIPLTASSEFRIVLKRLLAAEKSERYQSAAAALAELEETASSGQPSKARRRAGWVAVGIAASAAAVVLAWVSFPPEGSEASSVSSAHSSAVLDDSSSLGSPPPDANDLGGQGTRAPAPGVSEETPGQAQSPETRSNTALPLPSSAHDSGSVNLTCLPWGKIYLDGTYVGTTPLAGRLRVAVGQHDVMFSNPHFDPIAKSITVGREEVLVVEADFFQTAAYLLVAVSPWAEIYVDEQYRDTTPLSAPIVVSAGSRLLRLRHPTFGDRLLEVAIDVGDTLKIVHRFTPELLQ